MNGKSFWIRARSIALVTMLLLSFTATSFASAQTSGPSMLTPQLGVRTVLSGLTTPTTLAFLSSSEFLVLEKNTGKVQYILNGAFDHTALDLAVNFASERGLLGIALDPDFENNHAVYLYWSCSAPPSGDPFTPSETECADTPELGADTDDILAVPLLGNRVDRFLWDGSSLTFDHNLIKLRAFQSDGGPTPPDQGDEGQPARGNHDGGVIGFGQDGKLYIFIGDSGRRGELQNLACGPTNVYDCPAENSPVPDDQFGGPEPDDAHLTGVILRLNPDGSAPDDNPFFAAGASMGGEAGANVQKIFSYGHRNSFGMAMDPVGGSVWLQENGDDSFSELNRVEPGMNGGWIQIAGPVERLAQFREIETTFFAPPSTAPALQQLRWPPANIADSPEEALSRLFMLPGAEYADPAFSWKWEVAPGGIGFVEGKALGPQFEGDLFMGAATPLLEGGYLFHFNLTGNRRAVAVDDPRLEDRVADNLGKHEITESESLLIGRDFGVVTDIESGPNGNLFVVSLSNGAVYEIFATNPAASQNFAASLTGREEVPPRNTDATGSASFELSGDGMTLSYRVSVSSIENVFASHIHCGAKRENGPVGVTLFMGTPGGGAFDGTLAEGTITAPDAGNSCGWATLADVVAAMNSGNTYVNVHTNDGIDPPNTGPGDFPGGEIRGQIASIRPVKVN